MGFYVRSSLHSCETSVDIYFAVPPYMSVYFLVMYRVMHDYLDLNFDSKMHFRFCQNCASSRPSSSVGSSRPGSSPVPGVLDGQTVTYSSSSSTHSDTITQSFNKTSESMVYLLINPKKPEASL